MSRRLTLLGLAAAAILGAAVFAYRFTQQPAPVTPLLCNDSQTLQSAGLCPWRNPKKDMSAFFPGSDQYKQHLLVLSDLQSEILERLGPNSVMDANGIYCYRIDRSGKLVGNVLAQRAAGEYGSVEYVEAVDNYGRVAGVSIQRLREPETTLREIESPAWLRSFRGKSSKSKFELGADIPNVPEPARKTAQSLTESIRRLTVEYDVALENKR